MAKVVKSKEDLKKLQRQRYYKRGLQVAIVIGMSTSLYTYRLGRKRGQGEGINIGYVKAGHEIVESWRLHAEEMRLKRERDIS